MSLFHVQRSPLLRQFVCVLCAVVALCVPGFAQDSPAELTITKTASTAADVAAGSTVAPGGEITYHLEVTNTGGTIGTNAEITDFIPEGTTFVSASNNSQPLQICSSNGGATVCRDAVRFTDAAGVPPGVTGFVSFTVRVNDNVTKVTNLAADYSIRFRDPVRQSFFTNKGNRSVTTTVVNPNVPMLAINKQASTPGSPNGSTVRPEESIRYLLKYENKGQGAAQNVVITDTSPPIVNPTTSAVVGMAKFNVATFANAQGTPIEKPAGATVTLSSLGKATFTIPSLAAGASGFILLEARVPANAPVGFQIINRTFNLADGSGYRVTASGNHAATGPNIVTTVAAVSALTIKKSAVTNISPQGVSVGTGETITYTLRATNTGNSALSSIVIRDVLPNSVTLIPDSISGTSGPNKAQKSSLKVSKAKPTVVTFDAGNLPGGGVATLTFKVKVGQSPGTVVNSDYRVSSGDLFAAGPPVTTQIIRAITDAKSASALLPITKKIVAVEVAQGKPSSTLSKVPPGGFVTYQISFRNNSDQTLTDVYLSDRLPLNAAYVSSLFGTTNKPEVAPARPDGLGNPLVLGDDEEPQSVNFFIGNLPPTPANAPDRVITLKIQVAYGTPAGPLVNKDYKLQVLSPVVDVPGTKAASINVEIPPRPSGVSFYSGPTTPVLQLSKISETGDTVFKGKTITFRINYANIGSQTARGVTLEEVVPGGLAFKILPNLITGGGVLTASTRTIRWTLGDLAPGAKGFVKFAVSAPFFGTTITNDSCIISARNITQRVAARAVSVKVIDPVYVRKSANVDAVAAGEVISYTFVYGNAGNETVGKTQLFDRLPENTTFESALFKDKNGKPILLTGGSISAPKIGDSGNVKFNIPPMAPGFTGQAELNVRVKQKAPVGQPIVNQHYSIDSFSNSATGNPVYTNVTPFVAKTPKLIIEKIGPAVVVAGGDIIYTLFYANIGTRFADQVKIFDQVPFGTRVVDAGGFLPVRVQNLAATLNDKQQQADRFGVITSLVRSPAMLSAAIPSSFIKVASVSSDGLATVQWDVGLVSPGEAGYVQLRVRPTSLKIANGLDAFANSHYSIQGSGIPAATGDSVVTRILKQVQITPPATGGFKAVSGLILPAQPGTPVIAGGNFVLVNNSLIGNDGGSLVGLDGGSLVGLDGGSIISRDGAGVIGQNGATLVGLDGGSLRDQIARVIGQNGASVIGQNGATVIGQNGATVIGQNGASVIGQNGATLITDNGAAFLAADNAVQLGSGGVGLLAR